MYYKVRLQPNSGYSFYVLVKAVDVAELTSKVLDAYPEHRIIYLSEEDIATVL